MSFLEQWARKSVGLDAAHWSMLGPASRGRGRRAHGPRHHHAQLRGAWLDGVVCVCVVCARGAVSRCRVLFAVRRGCVARGVRGARACGVCGALCVCVLWVRLSATQPSHLQFIFSGDGLPERELEKLKAEAEHLGRALLHFCLLRSC